jgi:hypothetical protein
MPQPVDLEIAGKWLATDIEPFEMVQVPVGHHHQVQAATSAGEHVGIDDIEHRVGVVAHIPEVDPGVMEAVILIPRHQDAVAEQHVVGPHRQGHRQGPGVLSVCPFMRG